MNCQIFTVLSGNIFVCLYACAYFNSFNETLFQETDAAVTIKEIWQRDPYDHFPYIDSLWNYHIEELQLSSVGYWKSSAHL